MGEGWKYVMVGLQVVCLAAWSTGSVPSMPVWLAGSVKTTETPKLQEDAEY